MKTAMELLGYEDMRISNGFGLTDLELVAKRAREEMRREAQLAAIDAGADGFFDKSAKDCADRIISAIRALPVAP